MFVVILVQYKGCDVCACFCFSRGEKVVMGVCLHHCCLDIRRIVAFVCSELGNGAVFISLFLSLRWCVCVLF